MTPKFPYEDIIDLPPHISKKHPQASLADRAARFSPFAAITGYEEMVMEAARTTDTRIDLDDNLKYILDDKLNELRNMITAKPELHITHFVSDDKKSGGAYQHTSGILKRIDDYKRTLLLVNGIEIKIDDILDLDFFT